MTQNNKNLLDTLSSLFTKFELNPETAETDRLAKLSADREEATRQAMSDLLTSPEKVVAFEQAATENAAVGKKQFTLKQWGLHDAPRYNGRYLLDLLNKGNLLPLLQDYLDEHYALGDRRFRVYFYKAGNTFRLAVSWDETQFEFIETKLRENEEFRRKKQEEHDLERERRRVEGGNRPTDNYRYGRSGDQRGSRTEYRETQPRSDYRPRDQHERRGGAWAGDRSDNRDFTRPRVTRPRRDYDQH